jgi:co-chaperonin GroES (HSP10)
MSSLLVPRHLAKKRLAEKAPASAPAIALPPLPALATQGNHEIYDLDTPVPEGVPAPHRYLVLVMPVMVRSKIGSIFLPDQAVSDQLWINGLGKVCALGPGVYKGRRFEEQGLSPEDAPRIGDIVIYNAKSPNRITVDGRKLLFVSDDGLFGTVDPATAHLVQF